MTKRFLVSVLMLMLMGMTPIGEACAAEDPFEQKAPPTLEEVEGWFNALGSDSLEERESAKKAFVAAGQDHHGLLEQKSQSSDPIIRTQALEVLGMLECQPILNKYAQQFITKKGNSGRMSFQGTVMGQSMKGEGTFQAIPAKVLTILATDFEIMGQKINSKVISDGQAVWSLNKVNMGDVQIFKSSVQYLMKMGGCTNGQGGDLGGTLDQLRASCDFIKLEKGTLNDEQVWILRAKPKQGMLEKKIEDLTTEFGPALSTQVKMQMEPTENPVVYLSLTGIPRKLEYLDAAGKAILTTTFSDIKVGLDLDESLFVYAPLEGAKVIELEKMLEAMMKE